MWCVVTRDRMGRMLTFMGRIMQDEGETVVRGVGVDEHTALLLDVDTGDVSAVGVNTAYVCTPQHAPEVCTKDKPLTFRGKTRPVLTY
jgi:cyanophycinase